MKIKKITIIIIIILIILGLYAIGEVNYFSNKQIIEKDYNSPIIKIEKIGVEEKINNISISNGVYHEKLSFNPTQGEVILFGHRTLEGSPFLRLNELDTNNKIILEWPDIGEVNYTVTKKKIVPNTFIMNTTQNNQKLYLITCDPIGSTENRLIIEAEMVSVGELNKTIIQQNPKENYSYYIITIFFIIGLLISLICKEDKKYIIITTIIITIILIYFHFNPISPDIIYSKINWINGEFRV